MDLFLIFSTSLLLFFSPDEGWIIDLNGKSVAGSEPVMARGFISFPMGKGPKLAKLKVLDSSGRSCPSDFSVTGRWKDNSIRFLCFRTVVPEKLSEGKIKLGEGSPYKGLKKIAYRTINGNDVLIDTGPLEVTLSNDSPGVIKELRVHGSTFFSKACSINLRVFLGDLYRPESPRNIVIKKGNSETEAIIFGKTVSRSGVTGPDYLIKICFYPGSSRIYFRIKVSDSEMEGESRGIIFDVKPAWKQKKRSVKYLGAVGSSSTTINLKEKFKLVSNKKGVHYKYDEEEQALSSGNYTTVIVGANSRHYSFTVPKFKYLHPWNISITPSGRLSFSLLSDFFIWEKGFGCEREFVMRFKGNGRLKERPIRLDGPARAASFGLAGDFKNRMFPFALNKEGIENDPLYKTFISIKNNLLAKLIEEWAFWDGFRDYGDYRTDFGQFANCEFDPAYGLIKSFLICRQVKDLTAADTMLKHWIRFDCNGDDDLKPPGVPWMHGLDHNSGKIEIGHMWVDGALLYSILTDEWEYKESARAIGKYLLSASLKHENGINERSAAWGLMALTALVDNGLNEFKNGMDRYAVAL